MAFEWLGKMLGFEVGEPNINERSNKDGDSLTQDEAAFIVYSLKNKKPACPDCKEGFLVKGPEGCGSINCLCANCKSEFSIYWVTDNYLIGERISDKQNCCPVRQMAIYRIGQIPGTKC